MRATTNLVTPGRYGPFLHFRSGGHVRTVDYTMEVPR
jgi:hypothetical protein